jgi:Uma2 family endonuclease
VTITAHRPATYDDLLKLPENVVGEILEGELYASPRQAPRHNRAESALHARIFAAYDDGTGGPGGWWILIEPELHLQSDVLVPDIAGWRRERMASLPDTAWFDLAPDWICEVLSPSTGRIDRAKKLPIYAREAVPFAWFVDPTLKTVEMMKLNQDVWQILHVYGGEDQMTASPFEELTIDLLAVWGDRP